MFKISPIQDKETQERYAKACGVSSKDGFFAYGMTNAESGEIMGFSQFELNEGCGYVSDIHEALGYSDFEALFILARATMNFIDTCGIRTIKADENTADESLLLAVGFKKNETGEYSCDTTGMFDGHCEGSCK